MKPKSENQNSNIRETIKSLLRTEIGYSDVGDSGMLITSW